MSELIRISDIQADTPIVIPTSGGSIEMSVATVLQWIAPEAPPHEALKFLLTCRAAGVNPFLGEAHLVPMSDRWSTVVDKSGLIRRAEDHPQYDGFEAGIIVQPFDPKTGRAGETIEVEGAMMPDSGFRLLGGWAKVYRRDRSRPTTERVSVREYRRPGPNWERLTCTMIRKVALVQALRESGLISGGWYDQSEVAAEAEGDRTATEIVAIATASAKAIVGPEIGQTPPPLTMAIEAAPVASDPHERVKDLIVESGMQPDQVGAMLARRNAASVDDLSERDCHEIIYRLAGAIERWKAGEILLPDPKPEGQPPKEEAGEAFDPAASARFPWESDEDVKAQAEASE